MEQRVLGLTLVIWVPTFKHEATLHDEHTRIVGRHGDSIRLTHLPFLGLGDVEQALHIESRGDSYQVPTIRSGHVERSQILTISHTVHDPLFSYQPSWPATQTTSI